MARCLPENFIKLAVKMLPVYVGAVLSYFGLVSRLEVACLQFHLPSTWMF